jgi:modulator of FtsH protease HflC
MTSATRISFIVAASLVALIVLSSGFFVVDETQQVVITQFGEPVGNAITTPGLKFKTPLVQTANYFDKRFLEWDGDANQVPTRDKRFIWVDTYARWRISDPLTYLERLRGDESIAQSRLDDILDGETRNAIARSDLVQVVRTANRQPDTSESDEEETGVLDEIETGRADITAEIRATAAPRLAVLGIELVDFQLKRINYVAEVQEDVFARMIAERQRIAQQYRSEGEGEAARIRGERERDLQSIQSEAYRQAQETRGVADAEATRIYAEAYNRDSAFYAFTKSMETLEATIDPNTLLILSTDGELLQYLDNPR